MKRFMMLILGAVMALSLVACGGNEKESVGIANPFTEYSSLEEAEKAAGFSILVPESVDGYEQRIIRGMTGEDGNIAMLEVIFYQDDDSTERNEIRIRKAYGQEDISGDYNRYAESSEITVGEIPVSVKGENGKIQLATWVNGTYTYSIGFYSGEGVSGDTLREFVASVQ